VDEGSDGWQKRLEYLENTAENFVGRLTTILFPLVPIEALNSAVKTAHEIVGACRDIMSFSPRISPEEPEELFQLFATGQRLIGPRLKIIQRILIAVFVAVTIVVAVFPVAIVTVMFTVSVPFPLTIVPFITMMLVPFAVVSARYGNGELLR